ncbi:MAG: hypothetical protein KDB14_28655 [Planctomycetales bacterium]|nr:hypothetical protein [Planctomycetales bacterium]
MSEFDLSFNTRKALGVHLGEPAGHEIVLLLQRMAARIQELERSKVNVTPIAPAGAPNLLESTYEADPL